MTKLLPGLVLAMFILFGCNTYPAILTDLPGIRLKHADALFETGKYSEAIETYRKILKGSSFGTEAEKAQYRLAFTLSYYKNPQQDYAASLKEYQKAISRYPKSSYREEAENMISFLSVLISQKQQISAEQSKTKQLEERLLELQRLEIEAEQRRAKPRQD